MNTVKKLLCITLALALIFTMVACGGENPSSSQVDGSSSDVGSSNSDSSTQASSGSGGGGVVDTESGSNGNYRPNGDTDEDFDNDEENGEGIWDGKIAEAESFKGLGTADFPYLIYSPSQLAYAFTDGALEGKYYQLQNDVYLNDVKSKDWMKNKNNIPWVAGEFNGHLDGNGHCIYGIWFDSENQPKNAGLVSSLKAGSFKNLGIRNSFIVAKQYAGGFAGTLSASTEAVFDRCFVDETVYVQYTTKGTHGAGGLIGYCYGGTADRPGLRIENCYSKAQVSGLYKTERVNGIIGTSWNCSYSMKNCYSVGLAPYFGKGEKQASIMLSGSAKESEIYSNIYCDAREPVGNESFTLLDRSNMRGNTAKSKMKLNFSDVFETVSGGFPKLRIFRDINGKDISVLNIETMSMAEKDFKTGKGTKAEPFVITTAEELRKVVTGVWNDTYFVLGGNIKVNNTSGGMWSVTGEPWEVAKSTFAGNFDGKGYTISGLCYNENPAEGAISSKDIVALFPRASVNAVISNIRLSNSVISGKSYVGGIVGTVSGGGENYLKISGCVVDSTVYLTGQTVGGIFGGGGGGVEVSDCIFTGTIAKATGSDGYNNRGNGIVGDIWSTNYKILRCVSPEYPAYRNQFVPSVLEAVYTSVEQKGVNVLSILHMKGSGAKINMPDLDWTRFKTTTEYPTLK